MNDIFEPLFQYGFHDTDLYSIDCDGSKIKLNFNNGIYLLDEKGKETVLSKPIQIVLKVYSGDDSTGEWQLEIKEYGKKLKDIEYLQLKKYLQKDTFGVFMLYYSNFDNCLLFDGSIGNKPIFLTIWEIEEVEIKPLND